MPVYVLVSLLSFVCYSALIFVILKHKPRRWEHNTFVLFLLGAAIWASFALLRYLFPQGDVWLTGATSQQDGSAAKQGMLSTIYALAATVDARDHHTYGHSRQVSNFAVALGEALGLSSEKIAKLHTTALLHDIGKIGIADEVLNKSEHLSEQEWKPIHSHPTLGVSILRHIDGLAPCLPGIQYHHERHDGTGYPADLKGNNIPLDARIIAIADAFEAITSPRPYRQRTLTYQKALKELEYHRNTQFQGELVDVFVKAMRRAAPPELEATAR